MNARPHPMLALLWIVLTASIVVGCAGVIGCAGGHAPRSDKGEVAVDVTGVGFDAASSAHYVVLREHNGARTLPILIGDDEARAIMFEIRGIKPERPLTYELLRKVIEQTGNQVDRVVIADMRDEIYYANVYLDRGRYVVDSRPSDAIALAVGAHAPVFVADKLFVSGNPAGPGTSASIKTGYGLGVTVQELTVELAQYFGVAPMSGVVVADLDAPATRAGLQRGDIITNVDGHEIRTCDEFTRNAGALRSSNQPVSVAIRRAAVTQVITLNPAGGAQSSPSR